MTDEEDVTEDPEAEESPVRTSAGKKPNMLEIYGKRADTPREKLRAWSELLSEREEKYGPNSSFLGRWWESKAHWFRFIKRKRR